MKNKRKSFCSNCDKKTWHEILFEKSYQDTGREDYDDCSKIVVTECCGCEQPHYFLSSWTQNKDGSKIDCFDEWVFPPKSIHQSPSWYIDFAFSTVFDDVGEKKHVSDLLREVHVALEKNCPRLEKVKGSSLRLTPLLAGSAHTPPIKGVRADCDARGSTASVMWLKK